jgi:hypothetical protein
MKSQIYEAYVAGLSPLLLLSQTREHASDGHRRRPPMPAREETCIGVSPPSRRRRALLVVLAFGLGIGAWHFLSRGDEGRAYEMAAGDSALQEKFPDVLIAEREGASW